MTVHWIPMTPERFRAMREELEALKLQAVPQATGARHAGRDAGPEPPDAAVPGFAPEAEAAAADPRRERILALEEKIRRAQVIEPGQRDRVGFGAVVRVLDRDRNEEREYTLVGPEELDAESGRISPASPIGRALMGRAVGDTVTVRVPRGELRLGILAIH